MKTSTTYLSGIYTRLAFMLVFAIPVFLTQNSANAQIEPGCYFGHETISNIDYTFVGNGPTTYTGTYTQSTTSHVVWVFNLLAGQTLSCTYATGFNAYFWLYKANGNGIVEVGDNDPNGLDHICGHGGYDELQGPHSGSNNKVIATSGQYAVLMDNYTCETGTNSYSVTFTILDPQPSCMSLNMITRPAPDVFVAHGAGDLYSYYPGISATKTFKVCPTGGVPPYTAVWTTTDGILTQYGLPTTSNCFVTNGSAGVIYPTGPFKVKVTVTDANYCSVTDSMMIGYIDYTCNPPGTIWSLLVCNTQTTTTSCVKGTHNVAALLATGNYELGTCPTKTDQSGFSTGDFMIYPNPSSDIVTISYNAVENASGKLNVIDLNGRLIQSVEIGLYQGVVEYPLDLSYLANGIYFVQLISNQETVVQKIQIVK